jgi:coenzyme F420-reducing hydrogenase delta subunit/ferredoxin
MSDTNIFEPKIIAFVCNWCTYLGADLAGKSRLKYPANVRIIRLPCTGRIDFNFLVKAFEMQADAVLVSGCHPGDCHYASGNYHARRRWMLFRDLLDLLGFDMRRIHFAWISAAEGHKFQQVISEITEKTRELGPYKLYEGKPVAYPRFPESAMPLGDFDTETELRETARKLLSEGKAQVVIGYGERGPVFVTRAEDADKLVWNKDCLTNLTAYLKRKEIKALGKAAIVVKGCDERALLVLEQESQIERGNLHVIGMACEGLGIAKCAGCKVRQPRFADEAIGEAKPAAEANRYRALDVLMAMSPEERMGFWSEQFDRCQRCYACRQVCPMCYCEQCLVDKNRPQEIDTSPTRKGNFAWQIMRAFHQAGRCVGCGECTRICPVGIDLWALNLVLERGAEKNFEYKAGMEQSALSLIGTYSAQDKEEFIQ